MEKIINGYNGRYTIDSSGNVYSNGRLMSPYKINSGYLAIILQKDGARKHFLIHRLVAEAFLDGSGVVDHIDGNRENNNVENLRYCTQKENLHYNGYEYNSGTNHYKSAFSLEQVVFIRECREKHGMKNKDIYKMFPESSHTAIDQILNYKTYKITPC